MPRENSLSDRAYRLLLRALPLEFRGNFGDEMEETFKEQRKAAEREAGKSGLLRLWGQTIAGLFQTAPREHFSILFQDIRYAQRMMRNNPGYTFAAVMTLALGIGANAAIFSVINAILLRPLPYADGNRLVVVRQQAPKAAVADMRFSVHEVQDYREQNHTLGGVVEYHSMQFTLFGKGEAERVRTGVVSAGFFDLFGVKPTLGRTFLASDDQPGAPPVLLLSHEFWKEHQGSDPNIVGKTFQMNDRVHTVIGVLPPVPQYPNENDVYMPTSACPFRSSPQTIANRDARMMSVFARLKPGISQEQNHADLALIASRLKNEYPQYYGKNTGYDTTSVSLREELTKQARPTLFVLLGAAGFVLLIACANVANLTLARMTRRERELVVRTALGADRSRLLRQLLTESFLMALLASGLGLLFASGSLQLLVAFAVRLTPRAREITIDGPVLLFSIAIAFGTSIVFGSVSALATRKDVAPHLREGSTQATAGRSRRLVRDFLIVAQVAFSFMLLVGAGLLMRSLAKLEQVDPGFVPQRVLTMGLNLNWSKYKQAEQSRSYTRHLLEKVQNQPGVVSAAVSSSFPLDPDGLTGGSWTRRFQVEGHPVPDGEAPPLAGMRAGTPDYFKTLGISLLAGRTFLETDDEKALQVAVINQALAKHHWPGEDPVGRRVSFDKGETWIKIVGVVRDVKEFGLDKDPGDQMYRPMTQATNVGSLIARTTGDPLSMAASMRRAVYDIDSETAITNLETLEQARTDSMAQPKILTNLLGTFAVLALLIAITGIGGILALSVSQRVHEIGIRLALGAKPSHVLRMLVGQGMALVLAGLALGMAGALALTRLLTSLLFQVTPNDPITYTAVSLLIGVAALVACWLPSRRATEIDPLEALRCE
jgi:putative ABC transport system permease protein